jgi:hypothetical protein
LIEFIKEAFIPDSKNCHVFKKIDDISKFTKSILNCDEVIVWFENIDNGKFWSYHNGHQISVDKKKFDKFIYQKLDKYIYRSEDENFVEKLQNFIQIGLIENTLFHNINCQSCLYKTFVQVINLKDGVSNISKSVNDVVEILSFFVSQTVKIEDVSQTATYYKEEQERAFNKQKTVIKNDFQNSSIFKTETFYRASDILSGDSYSFLKAKNGDFMIYLIDAMGHGIAPSLTAYSLSAIIQQKIKNSSNFNDIMVNLLDNAQYILTDEEQLTCGFFWFSSDLKKVDYVVAGMYAPLILDGDEIISAKANNIPFMNFAFDLNISTIELQDFKKILLFSDGLIEDEDLEIDPKSILVDKSLREDIFRNLETTSLEDDTTILFLEKR